MTIDGNQIFLYFLALVILFLTPGPVWVALIARTVSGGAKSSISLALGVSLGDMLWPFVVYFSLSLLISLYSDILLIFRYVASFVLILMGLQIIYLRNKTVSEDHRLTKSGFIAGFYAGFIAVTANPKASLFYMTLLPGFFNFELIGIIDVCLISLLSFSIPMIGNILMILFVAKVRSLLSSPYAVRMTNLISGILLVFVGISISIF
ncbi:MAG: LysE family translocator [Alphaproteobacteria bacterium]|jgi:threonine/homoserine/homoserine lactone efflux protein|nr:MAG: LysE family translocator [Alphaproteobacteria bacterium]